LVVLRHVEHHVPVLQPRVRLVVLNYNGGAMTRRCLQALGELDWPADRLELVLVDNASTDGLLDEVRRELPRVRVIESGGNLGFPANNLGLVDLDGVDYVGLVNNDAFVERGWLTPLVEALESDPAAGAASSKIVFAARFRSVRLVAPTFRPGAGDPRELGVQVLGVRVAGVERTAVTQAVGGAHPLEAGPDGPFWWTSATAELRIPLPDAEDGTQGPAEDEEPVVELLLRSPRGPVEARVEGANGSEVVPVGPEAAWHRVPLVGPVVDVINNVGSIVFEDGHGADRGYLEADLGQYDAPADLFAWCGASVLLRPAYLEDVGLLEERFFMYYEDTDLSWRGRARGWRHRYVPTSVIRHVHAATSVEGSAMFVHHVERNRLLMLIRNAPASMAVRQVLLHLRATASYARRDVLGAVVRRHRPNPTTVRRRLRAELAVLGMLPWALRSRRTLRRRQVVPDRELLAELVAR
jgi:GT2 family glycosyltransferase